MQVAWHWQVNMMAVADGLRLRLQRRSEDLTLTGTMNAYALPVARLRPIAML
jgi:hypothetical protein